MRALSSCDVVNSNGIHIFHLLYTIGPLYEIHRNSGE